MSPNRPQCFLGITLLSHLEVFSNENEKFALYVFAHNFTHFQMWDCKQIARFIFIMNSGWFLLII